MVRKDTAESFLLCLKPAVPVVLIVYQIKKKKQLNYQNVCLNTTKLNKDQCNKL